MLTHIMSTSQISPAVPSESPARFGVHIARGVAYGKQTEISTHLDGPARIQMWVAVISICVLMASAIVAVVRSITVSYANVPGQTISVDRQADSNQTGFERGRTPPAGVAIEGAAISQRNRAGCRECGVIESISQIERYGDVGRPLDVNVTTAEGDSGGAFVAGGKLGKSYDITVRFRDGSTIVFNEPTPRSWRPGSRVIVIAGSRVSSD